MEFQIALPGSYEVAYECSICKKGFNNLLALENHQRFTHYDNEENDNNNSTNEAMRDLSVFHLIQLKKKHDFPDFNVYFLDQNRPGCDVKKLYLVVQGDDKKTTTMNLEEFIQKGTILSKAPVSNISGPFKCTWMSINHGMECGEIFLNCCEYSIHHRDKHTKRRKTTGALRCQVCEKLLESPNAQSPAVEFPCHLCGQVFMNALQLEVHTKGYHTKVKPFKCSICEKRFTQSGGLQQHMRMHTGARPYKCNFCNKGFTQKGGLDQHLRTHTKGSPIFFPKFICWLENTMAEGLNPIHNMLCDPKEPVGGYDALPLVLKEFIRKQKAESSFPAHNGIWDFMPAPRANDIAPVNRPRRNEDPNTYAIRPCGET
ncbi:unnamed protein product [Pieris brassicae]|uniref:C2H2-type domain-containing protein n=1 Tax=Pieris brassicae TaxID=7116 RepID=A0A9P0U0C3_PIEBR|nr:unnamed protein product [Pieris brassicae]